MTLLGVGAFQPRPSQQQRQSPHSARQHHPQYRHDVVSLNLFQVNSLFPFWSTDPHAKVVTAQKQELLDLTRELKAKQQQQPQNDGSSSVFFAQKSHDQERLAQAAQVLEEGYAHSGASTNSNQQQQQQQSKKRSAISYFQSPVLQQRHKQPPPTEWTLLGSDGPPAGIPLVAQFLPAVLDGSMKLPELSSLWNSQTVSAVRVKRRQDERMMEQVIEFRPNQNDKEESHYHQLAFSYVKAQSNNNSNKKQANRPQRNNHWYRLETLTWKEFSNDDGTTATTIKSIAIPKFVAPKIHVETTYLDRDLLLTRTGRTGTHANPGQVQIYIPYETNNNSNNEKKNANTAATPATSSHQDTNETEPGNNDNDQPSSSSKKKKNPKSLFAPLDDLAKFARQHHHVVDKIAPALDLAKTTVMGIMEEQAKAAQAAQQLAQRREQMDDSVSALELEIAEALRLADVALEQATTVNGTPEEKKEEEEEHPNDTTAATALQQLTQRQGAMDASVDALELEIAEALRLANRVLQEEAAKEEAISMDDNGSTIMDDTTIAEIEQETETPQNDEEAASSLAPEEDYLVEELELELSESVEYATDQGEIFAKDPAAENEHAQHTVDDGIETMVSTETSAMKPEDEIVAETIASEYKDAAVLYSKVDTAQESEDENATSQERELEMAQELAEPTLEVESSTQDSMLVKYLEDEEESAAKLIEVERENEIVADTENEIVAEEEDNQVDDDSSADEVGLHWEADTGISHDEQHEAPTSDDDLRTAEEAWSGEHGIFTNGESEISARETESIDEMTSESDAVEQELGKASEVDNAKSQPLSERQKNIEKSVSALELEIEEALRLAEQALAEIE